MITKEKILDVLKTVINPEIGINIVDLGLVYNVELNEEAINITMTLTTPGCPMHSSITSWVENAIQYKEPDKKVNVFLVWEPQWTPDKMTDEARQQLGM